MMLIDILHKINKPLAKTELAQVLFSLIQPGCDIDKINSTNVYPYTLLQPVLNDNYTCFFIRNLHKDKYTPLEISSLLVHLFRYSLVCNVNSLAAVTLQPRVMMKVGPNGNFVLNYQTFNMYRNSSEILTQINDFSFIEDPIKFIETPCIYQVPKCDTQIDQMDALFSPEKCDQYMAYTLMMAQFAPQQNDNQLQQQQQGEGIDMGQARRNRNQQQRQQPQKDRNKLPAGQLISLAYLVGYYCYDIPSVQKGRYVFKQ